MSILANSREHERFVCDRAVHLHCPTLNRSFLGRVKDESEGGLFIELDENDAELFEDFTFGVALEMRHLVGHRIGRVRWTGHHGKHETFGIGVAY